ncbi:MAG: hypothetical protein J5789_07260 [Oscillospiraceae bacterium]|nr:hypothetical protein [Oscillospiraceae bacterium]
MFHKNITVSFKNNAVSISNPDFTIARLLVFLLMTVSFSLLFALKSSLWVGVYIFSLGFLALLIWIFTPFSCMIDASGIKAKSMVRERTLGWASLRDYGIAYGHYARYNRYYLLYFADSVLPEKRRERKRFHGRVVKISIDERAVLSKGQEIMAFCAQFTGVAPFIADPDNHTGWF